MAARVCLRRLQLPSERPPKSLATKLEPVYVPADTYPTGNYMYGILPLRHGVQSGAVIPSAPRR